MPRRETEIRTREEAAALAPFEVMTPFGNELPDRALAYRNLILRRARAAHQRSRLTSRPKAPGELLEAGRARL